VRKFIVSFLLIVLILSVGWEYIGTISLKFLDEHKEPEVRQYIIEKWIANIKEIHPHCRGAYIEFREDGEDSDLVGVFAKCYKWGI